MTGGLSEHPSSATEPDTSSATLASPGARSGFAATHGSRLFGLDLLRAVAILMVVYIHGGYLIEDIVPFTTYIQPTLDGVSFFFVLSGYLIGRILLRDFVDNSGGVGALREFWIRRWFRTLPNYYFILVSLLALFLISGREIAGHVGLYFVFAQNLFLPHPDFFPEAWSLAIEEWFYLLMPLVFIVAMAGAATPGERRRRALLAILAVIAFATIARLLVLMSGDVNSYETWDALLRKRVFTRVDAIAIGVLGAYLSLYCRRLWMVCRIPAALVGLLVLLIDNRLTLTTIFYPTYFTLSIVPLATLLLLPFLSAWREGPGLFGWAVSWVSRLSYSMYLVNLTLVQGFLLPAVFSGSDDGPVRSLTKYIVYWIATFAISGALYRWVELPMMNLRERVSRPTISR